MIPGIRHSAFGLRHSAFLHPAFGIRQLHSTSGIRHS
jgi:hypothetical protein